MNFTVYKSSAGSGKTFTLVKEYLVMVIKQPASFRNILAITFTNKAANELKERVINYLQVLSSDDASPDNAAIKFMLPALVNQTGLNPELIRERAAKTLSLILHNYSDFAIGTIDSFVHRIIKTFAYDLNLPINFDVEMDADEHLNRAIDILINKIGVDAELTDILVNFTKLKTSEEADWKIENDLLKFSRTLIREDSLERIEKLKGLTHEDFKDVARKTEKFINNFKKQLSIIAQTAVDLIHSKNLPDQAFYRGQSGVSVYFKRLAKRNNENFESNSYVKKTINEDNWYSGKAEENDKLAIDSIKDDLRKCFVQINDVLDRDLGRFKLYKIVQKQIYPIAVLSEIAKIIEEQKHQNNLIHISEFNKKVADIVFREPVPFIYERLGERYKSFLIDEFQDTSILQWQNFIPLIDNSLSEGYFNMLVGDGKQAIYRFRSGEVEQFEKLPELFRPENLPLAEEREQSLKRNFKLEYLSSNFRSRKEIVAFNNEFFKLVSEKLDPGFKTIYKQVDQQFDKNNTGGYVQIDLLEKSGKEAWTESNLNKVREIIEELRADHYQYRDITVLCRNNDEITTTAGFLLQHDYPVITSESLVLGASEKVNFLITILRYLTNPAEKIYKAGILKFLVETGRINLPLQDVLNYVHPIDTEKNEGNLQKDVFAGFLETQHYQLNQAKLLSLPVYDLCEEFIRIFELNAEVDPFVQFFLDAVLKSNAREDTDLFGFLDWWERNQKKESVVVPENLDAIQIMSIHKSKGLEFPVVIYPFANDITKLRDAYRWVELNDPYIDQLKTVYIPLSKAEDKQDVFPELHQEEVGKTQLDLMNLMYVAFTRPSERLYIITEKLKKEADKFDSVSKIIQYYLIKSGRYLEDQTTYTLGERLKVASEKEIKMHQSVELKTLISDDWRKKLLISTNAPEIWDVSNPERNKEWGKLLHLVLSKVRYKEDTASVISFFVDSGIIPMEEREKISKVLEKIMQHEQLRTFFEKGLKIKNEAEIILPDGHTLRPDRLIFEENKLTIIDYKTGKPEPKHAKQINTYGRVLAEMGYSGIQKYLIYLNDEIMVEKVN